MKQFIKSDIQVSGRRVLAKQHQEHGSFIWVCIVEFHFQNGICIDPETQAENYARTITGKG